MVIQHHFTHYSLNYACSNHFMQQGMQGMHNAHQRSIPGEHGHGQRQLDWSFYTVSQAGWLDFICIFHFFIEKFRGQCNIKLKPEIFG